MAANMTNDGFDGFLALPDELLLLVFEQLVTPQPTKPTPSTRDWENSYASVYAYTSLQISHISRRLRRLMRETPTFWTSLSNAMHPKLLKMCLELSEGGYRREESSIQNQGSSLESTSTVAANINLHLRGKVDNSRTYGLPAGPLPRIIFSHSERFVTISFHLLYIQTVHCQRYGPLHHATLKTDFKSLFGFEDINSLELPFLETLNIEYYGEFMYPRSVAPNIPLQRSRMPLLRSLNTNVGTCGIAGSGVSSFSLILDYAINLCFLRRELQSKALSALRHLRIVSPSHLSGGFDPGWVQGWKSNDVPQVEHLELEFQGACDEIRHSEFVWLMNKFLTFPGAQTLTLAFVGPPEGNEPDKRYRFPTVFHMLFVSVDGSESPLFRNITSLHLTTCGYLADTIAPGFSWTHPLTCFPALKHYTFSSPSLGGYMGTTASPIPPQYPDLETVELTGCQTISPVSITNFMNAMKDQGKWDSFEGFWVSGCAQLNLENLGGLEKVLWL